MRPFCYTTAQVWQFEQACVCICPGDVGSAGVGVIACTVTGVSARFAPTRGAAESGTRAACCHGIEAVTGAYQLASNSTGAQTNAEIFGKIFRPVWLLLPPNSYL